MIQLSFPTKKLKNYIKRVNVKLKDTNYNQNDLTVYGVTNTEGITITGNQTSKDLSNYIVLKENQLAYNPYRVNVGSIGLAPKGLLGLVSPAYIIFETTEELNPEFLYYYLKSSLGINLIKWYGDRGGVRSALRYKDLCEIDIPDLNLMQQIDALNKMKEENKEIEKFNNEICYQEQLISKLRQSILQEAVQGKLVPQDPNDEPASVLLERIKEVKERLIKEGKIKKEKPLPPITEDEIPYELPKGWEWVRLGELCSYIQRGKSPKYSNIEEIPVISQKCIQWDGFDISKARFIDPMSLDSYTEERFIVPFDLLWNSTGLGTLGRINVYPKIELYNKVVADSHVTVIRPLKEFVCSKYLYLWFAGPIVQSEINNKSTGSTKQTELNITTVREYIVPLPPLNYKSRLAISRTNKRGFCS